jgi:DNA topoisomerase-3
MDLRPLLQSPFGFDAFRPHQEEACVAAARGEHVLIVMPTGAGKSACFQLPGLARRRAQGTPSFGRTTLVVSPLIALMNDQVAKLKKIGLSAETINSTMHVEDQRAVAIAYNRGELDFLYISPERLAMRGVPEWLGRRPPALVAIDEAHCISHWGHDFRPDYRLMASRLPIVCGGTRNPGVPIAAVTATATPIVQQDIIERLGIKEHSNRFVHGFRRTNLAVEVLDVAPHARSDATAKLLRGAGRLPAIVYVRLRAQTEELAFELRQENYIAQPFHAGLPPALKKRTQEDFTSGAIDVVVATIAFGMGVDKPNVRTVVHTAVPDSIENYYQEIGRAGRDGDESSVVLFYSAADEKQHEWFFRQNYPEPEVLGQAFDALADTPQRFEEAHARTSLPARAFAEAIEKLHIHDGAVVEGFDADRWVQRSVGDWRVTYEAQRRKKRQDLDEMVAYASRKPEEKDACRMTELVRYFGDQEGGHAQNCGICDACLLKKGEQGAAKRSGAADPSEDEAALAERILNFLGQHDGQALGKLYRALHPGAEQDFRKDERDLFEHTIGALDRSGRIWLKKREFPKEDGGKVKYLIAYLSGDEKKRRTPTPPPRTRGKKTA